MKPVREEDFEDFVERPTVFVIERNIYFYDDVNNKTVCEAIKFLDMLEKKSNKEITISINSYGGDIYQGLALYDRIRNSACKITTIGTGIVASMGLIVFLAGDHRLLTENTIILNHQGSGEIAGKTSDFKIEAREMSRLEKLSNEIISERTGIPIKTLLKDVKEGDKYIAPPNAVKQRYAHGLIANLKSKS